MYQNCPVDFQTFINRKFLEWQMKRGTRQTVDDFAAYLGVNRSIVSMWMNGIRKPGRKYKQLLVDKFGDEAVESLGEDPRLFYINENWDDADPELQQFIVEQLKSNIAQNETKRSHIPRKKTVP